MNSEDFQSVEYEVVGKVARVTLNRPEHFNAIDLHMPGELERSIELANFDDNVKVILLSGKNVFCSGYDLKLFAGERGVTPGSQKMPWDPYTDYQMMNRCNKAWMSIWHSLKPVVAKIRAVAIGGGSDIALCCDVTFTSDDARIGYPPSRIWGCPTTAMWCYRVGMERAKRILFAGEILSGKKAASIGLIGEAVSDEDLDSAVDSFVERIISVPTNQLFFQKQVINQVIEQMGLLNTQRLATVFDGMSRHTPEGVAFHQRMQEIGFKKAVQERDSGAMTVWSNTDDNSNKSKL
ncbi:hypothetical protein CAPTEDRAFT_127607 [Capitella teleta]|uniref:Enoyl-CoA hydratase n=1 Tax=Capitella teleta TaxID=283909 RepID=R7TE26_CAPTE|nr:hypothetical protein CAPTEDRAFT_127607 [Capitella teleta]|eukprot:ELT89301.1 hypothetical protein CAPTEDRAFT_127607 [Capitella teleta]